MRRKFGKKLLLKLILCFFIATVIFIDIFVFANIVSQLNYKTVQDKNNVIRDYLEDANQRLDNFVCDRRLLEKSSLELDEVGMKLGLLEQRFGKGDQRVLDQKKLYFELEQTHLDLTKTFERECNLDFLQVLFFYNNDELYEDASEKMGYILTSFKKKDSSKIMIYSFDCNIPSEIISELREEYNVSSCPSVLVNGGNAFYLRNIDELEIYLEE